MQTLENGAIWYPSFFDRKAQEYLVESIRDIVSQAPLYTPKMPRTGKAMSVRMTNCGDMGWVTDKENGYRYQSKHPVTDNNWPQIPKTLANLWEELSNYPHPAEACLINFYDKNAKMGMHQDCDENNLNAPVISVSLGDSCLFRIGGTQRGGKTTSFKLQSGDVVILGGPARMTFHGVDKIYPGTSTLLKNTGRINLTLRRVT